MAKNKTPKKAAQPERQSPQEWMRAKGRTLPFGSIYMSYRPGAAPAAVVVSRVRPSGNVAYAVFFIDTFCLGVRKITWHSNVRADEFAGAIEGGEWPSPLREVPYAEAHNLVYGAVEWATEAGIAPAPGWDPARFLLEEDTDEIPYVDYEFGDAGRYHLIVDARPRDAQLIPALERRLGDRFVATFASREGSDKTASSETKDTNTPNREPKPVIPPPAPLPDLPHEPYAYPDRPAYPRAFRVRNRRLRDALLLPANLYGLPADILAGAMEMKPDHLSADLAVVMLRTAALTYPAIDASEGDVVADNSAVLHALILAACLGSRPAIPAVIDLLRQSPAYIAAHLGDAAPVLLSQALYRLCGHDLSHLEELLSTPGMSAGSRYSVARAIAMTAINEPARRAEAIALFRRELRRLAEAIPLLRAADGHYAAMLALVLTDLRAVELCADLRALYDAGLVAGYFEEPGDGNAGAVAESYRPASVDDYLAVLARTRSETEPESL